MTYLDSIEKTLSDLETTRNGLSEEEAKAVAHSQKTLA